MGPAAQTGQNVTSNPAQPNATLELFNPPSPPPQDSRDHSGSLDARGRGRITRKKGKSYNRQPLELCLRVEARLHLQAKDPTPGSAHACQKRSPLDQSIGRLHGLQMATFMVAGARVYEISR